MAMLSSPTNTLQSSQAHKKRFDLKIIKCIQHNTYF